MTKYRKARIALVLLGIFIVFLCAHMIAYTDKTWLVVVCGIMIIIVIATVYGAVLDAEFVYYFNKVNSPESLDEEFQSEGTELIKQLRKEISGEK